MTTLSAQLLDPQRRQAVIDDCVALVDAEVAKKSGLSGLAIKGAYGVVKALKKGIIRESVDMLLDGFIEKLEPFYAARNADEPLAAQLMRKPSEVADALLSFTDDNARVAKNQTMKKVYEKLRPTAKEHVQSAVPGIAALIERHSA